MDGRFKPDVSTVGQTVMSARSDGTQSLLAAKAPGTFKVKQGPSGSELGLNQCEVAPEESLLGMMGTSMATPITAGAGQCPLIITPKHPKHLHNYQP